MSTGFPAANALALAAATAQLWLRDELAYAWRAAQTEAVAAYEAWRATPGRDAHAVYTAAQDRADRAQDLLAGVVRGEDFHV
jgi:hypothetical protein